MTFPLPPGGLFPLDNPYPRSLLGRVIGTWSDAVLGVPLKTTGLTPNGTDRAWPGANAAVLYPFSVDRTGYIAYEGWVQCGTGAGGNFDVGIVSTDGVVLTSSGSTARSASAYVNTTGMTNYPLPVGDYYLALACDGTSNFVGFTATAAGQLTALGVKQAASAFPLSGTLTLDDPTTALIFNFGITLRTVAP